MISVEEFVRGLDVPMKFLAGNDGSKNLCRDVTLLTTPKVWLQKTEGSEFKNTLVFVQAHMFPAYSFTFDLLLRFFKQVNVAGILFQGGSPSDFSKATLMLADFLGLPLVWISASISYSAVARRFYTVVVQHTQQTRQQLHQARKQLEAAQRDSFSLAAWLNAVEHELSVTATLALSNQDRIQRNGQWWTQDGQLQFTIPVQVLDQIFHLRLTPKAGSPLLQEEARAIWSDELEGLIAAQTAYFVLAEVPGITSQVKWACSVEHVLYDVIARLPVMRLNTDASAKSDEEDSAHLDIQNVLSSHKHLAAVQPNSLRAIRLLWIKRAANAVDRQSPPLPLRDLPYAYGTFAETTLNLRHHVLNLCRDNRFSFGAVSVLNACVPWRDWRDNEGVVLFGFDTEDKPAEQEEPRMRAWVEQLEIRLQTSLRAYFYRKSVGDVEQPLAFLATAVAMVQQSYLDFMRVIEQAKSIQFAENREDVVNRILPNPLAEPSYHQVLQILKPLLDDKSGEPLLEALEAYLECGGKMQVAADKLYLHRNTLRYRLKRAEKLLNIRLDDDEVRFTYQFAIRTWRLANATTLTSRT